MGSEGSWVPFGKGLGRSWAVFRSLLDAFWLIFGRSKSYLLEALVQDELQEAFWMDFGSRWEGSGMVLGGLGKNLKGFGTFWTSNGQIKFQNALNMNVEMLWAPFENGLVRSNRLLTTFGYISVVFWTFQKNIKF